MDFRYGPVVRDRNEGEDTGILDDMESFTWILLGSCKVRDAGELENKARRARGAFGLIIYPVEQLPPGGRAFPR